MRPNNRMQRDGEDAAADAERSAEKVLERFVG